MIQPKSGGSLIGKISSYLQIVSKDAHSTAFVPLAEAYRQIGLLDDALAAARMGTTMLPHFSPGFATLGRILGQMGRVDEAINAYARALNIDRQSQSALIGLARLHLIRGEREMARCILLQAAEFHPQDEMVENMLVALDLPRPWRDEPTASLAAQSVVASAVTEEPAAGAAIGEPIPTATLAEIYATQGLVDQAVHVYEEILRLEPDNAVAARRLMELRGVSVADTVASDRLTPVEAATLPMEQGLAPRQPLEVFDRWLQAIRMRRAHVQ